MSKIIITKLKPIYVYNRKIILENFFLTGINETPIKLIIIVLVIYTYMCLHIYIYIYTERDCKANGNHKRCSYNAETPLER